MDWKPPILGGLMAVVLAIPFLLQREGESILNPDGVVVVITPHNEAIRYEFGQGFREWYAKKTGLDIVVDWRVIGGTSEIVRKIESDYLTAFRQHWTRDLGREWGQEVQVAFYNRRIKPDGDAQDDSLPELARRKFLESEVSCGMDVFFGGGSYDFIRQAEAGALVNDGLRERHPEWFDADSLPQTFAGEPFWDPAGRWYGAVLSTFGVIFNRDSLERLGYKGEPAQWEDLADPRFFGEVALADPTKSGSITKAFEMILQQEMQAVEAAARARGLDAAAASREALETGWKTGMRRILRIAANGRYFTDSSTKPSLDVSAGDCAVGMSIDFYGRQQAEFNLTRSGSDRFGYVAPAGGTTVSVDPIALFRGAPNRAYAEAFIEYVLSEEGQKLWNYRTGTPGGPRQYALRRAPARVELYAPEHAAYKSDPEVNDYDNAGAFVYRAEWTGPLFSHLRYLIRVVMIDPHEELKEAWKAVLEAEAAGRTQAAEAARAEFLDISDYELGPVEGRITEVLRSGNPIEEVRLSKELADRARARYARVVELAGGE